MDALHNLAFGFQHALTLQNLMFCAIGCTVGTLVGLLPGLGPLATISLLLPLTYSIPTGGALIMLAGIYYGAQYGDSVSAITMKIPHASSIVACIDGYQMTLKGQTDMGRPRAFTNTSHASAASTADSEIASRMPRSRSAKAEVAMSATTATMSPTRSSARPKSTRPPRISTRARHGHGRDVDSVRCRRPASVTRAPSTIISALTILGK